jgi:hypothetical protein
MMLWLGDHVGVGWGHIIHLSITSLGGESKINDYIHSDQYFEYVRRVSVVRSKKTCLIGGEITKCIDRGKEGQVCLSRIEKSVVDEHNSCSQFNTRECVKLK